MDELIRALKVLLADTVALKYKAQGYHWNVEGKDFKQHHDFFADIYKDFGGAIDDCAEWIRIMGEYSPYRITDFFDLSTVGEPVLVGDPQPMFVDLYDTIEKHKEDIKSLTKLADSLGENGLVDFLASRQASSQKFCWMMKSFMKGMEY